jgi:hypothetical protein
MAEQQDPLESIRIECLLSDEIPIDAPLEQESSRQVKGGGEVVLGETGRGQERGRESDLCAVRHQVNRDVMPMTRDRVPAHLNS